MTTWADPSTVRSAIRQQWSEGQIACRGNRNHWWDDRSAWRGRGFVRLIQRCARCGNQRWAEFNLHGVQLSPWQVDEYSEGYLLEPGSGRVGADGMALLRAALIAGRAIHRDNDMSPRSKRTREKLEGKQ